MALLGDRHILETDISYTLSDVAERGLIVMMDAAGSGVAIGDSAGTVQLATNPSGLIPAGLLLNDFVDIDQTIQHVNFDKDQMVIGNRATILRKGWVVSDQITGTPTLGATAYVTANGQMTPTKSATGGTAATPPVGQFLSLLDENGFAKVEIKLPA